ncbi:MAG: hypothetical protein PVJ71_08220, partial [Lysobacterales bacterium]
DALQQALVLDPTVVQNYMHLSDWHYQAGHVDESIISLSKAISHDPRRGFISSQLGLRYGELGDLDKAIAWARHGLEQSPDNLFVQVLAMHVFIEVGDTESANQCVESILQMHPVNPFALRQLGAQDIAAGQAQAAIERWQKAWPMFVNLQGPINNYIVAHAAVDFASHLVQAGDPERAENLLLNSLGALAGDPMYLSYAHAMLGNRQETLAIIRDAVEGRRNHVMALWYRLPEYDFLRADADFLVLMKTLEERIAAQSARIREMVHNGEIPPPPTRKEPVPD